MKDDTSHNFYILRERVTNLGDNYNRTSNLGKNVQVKLLYKAAAAPPPAAPAPQPSDASPAQQPPH